jgi:hypothetical protein
MDDDSSNVKYVGSVTVNGGARAAVGLRFRIRR